MDFTFIIFQVTLCCQLLSHVAAQYPMPYPGSQMAPPMQQMPQMPQMPSMPPMPYPMPMPGPLPMPIAMPQPRLPVVVMPFRSKDAKNQQKKRKHRHSHKKKRKHKPRPMPSSNSDSSDTDTDCWDDAELDGRRKGMASRRHQVLTPVISYVTKDGYVVYQKKIKKERAKDWLELGKKKSLLMDSGESTMTSEEITLKKSKRRRY